MHVLFIADLHLSPKHPRLVRGFLQLLSEYQGRTDQLYILGDWFEAWIGDDDVSVWLDNIVYALQQFKAGGSQIFFMHGNRDFALGQPFMDRFGGQLIKAERISIDLSGLRLLLEHGDALCTDDVSYQRFKKIIRNPLLLKTILALPLSVRRKIANLARQQSNTQKIHTHTRPIPADIMDVNENEVALVLTGHDVLVHGHTHRPAIHNYSSAKQRVVLGDWRLDSHGNGTAMIGLFDKKGLQLIEWNF